MNKSAAMVCGLCCAEGVCFGIFENIQNVCALMHPQKIAYSPKLELGHSKYGLVTAMLMM